MRDNCGDRKDVRHLEIVEVAFPRRATLLCKGACEDCREFRVSTFEELHELHGQTTFVRTQEEAAIAAARRSASPAM